MSDDGEDKPFIPLKAFRWEVIDHSLVGLKMTDLAIEMRRQMDADERRIQFENRLNMNSATVPSRVLQMKEKCADEWAGRAYEIYCGVWKIQGYAKSAPFVRAVCARSIIPMLRSRAGAIKHEFLRFATRTSLNCVVRDGQLKGFELRMLRLQDQWQRRLEAEAKECEHLERRNRLTAVIQPERLSLPEPPPIPVQKLEIPPLNDARLEAIIRKVRNPQAHTILSVPETALYFGVKPRTVHRWIAEGKLQNGGRRGAVTIESIRRWEAKRSRRHKSS